MAVINIYRKGPPRKRPQGVAADVTGCAKTPKWHFGRTKKGFSDPSPPKKTRHIETVEVVFPGSPAGEEFSHSLVTRRIFRPARAIVRLVTSAATIFRDALRFPQYRIPLSP